MKFKKVEVEKHFRDAFRESLEFVGFKASFISHMNGRLSLKVKTVGYFPGMHVNYKGKGRKIIATLTYPTKQEWSKELYIAYFFHEGSEFAYHIVREIKGIEFNLTIGQTVGNFFMYRYLKRVGSKHADEFLSELQPKINPEKRSRLKMGAPVVVDRLEMEMLLYGYDEKTFAGDRIPLSSSDLERSVYNGYYYVKLMKDFDEKKKKVMMAYFFVMDYKEEDDPWEVFQKAREVYV